MAQNDLTMKTVPDIKKALSEAVKAIYFADSSDYGTALWQIVRALGGEEAVNLLDENEEAAWEKYVGLKD